MVGLEPPDTFSSRRHTWRGKNTFLPMSRAAPNKPSLTQRVGHPPIPECQKNVLQAFTFASQAVFDLRYLDGRARRRGAAERSDGGRPADWPFGHGSQGDAIGILNCARLVRDAEALG